MKRTIIDSQDNGATQYAFRTNASKGALVMEGTGSVTLHAADTDFTITTINSGEPYQFDLAPGFDLYAIVATGTGITLHCYD